jgi:hypothetical protein
MGSKVGNLTAIQREQKRNTGVLHYVQDDGLKRKESGYIHLGFAPVSIPAMLGDGTYREVRGEL